MLTTSYITSLACVVTFSCLVRFCITRASCFECRGVLL